VAQPHLALVDLETGEVKEQDDCPSCLQYERQIRVLNSRLTQLQKDKEAEGREHKLWPEAEALHTWWALATGHEGCSFEAEELYQAVPRLKEHTAIGILQGIAGIAYDPNERTIKNGGSEKYDSWELLMKSGPRLKRYQERAPGWPVKPNQWKHWLLDRIESRFK
jgi:hypothetical protein